MYKDMDIAERASKLERLAFQLNVLDSIIQGPYVSGNDMGLADAALFPTLTFCKFMLPEIFGWKQDFMGSKLQAYWDSMQADADASQVRTPRSSIHITISRALHLGSTCLAWATDTSQKICRCSSRRWIERGHCSGIDCIHLVWA